MDILIVFYIMTSLIFTLLDSAYLITEKTHLYKLLNGLLKLFIILCTWPSIVFFSGLFMLKSVPTNIKIIFQNIKKHHFKG